MHVGMYYNNQDVRLEKIAKPVIADGEILIKMKASGICGSDVMQWYRIKKAPLVLGHEVTGEIVEIGKGVSGYKIGDRVFASHHVPCNSCYYCLSGNHTVCKTLHTTNFYPGGFAEYIRVPPINVDRGVFILPEEISFEDGTFIEPLACVIRGQRVINLVPGQSVAILGAGISGILHLLLARSLGVERVAVTDVHEYRLNMARDFGADAAINAKEDIIAEFLKVNDNRLADIVIVCTSALNAFNQALKLVDKAGTILCFAPTEPGVNLSVPVNDFWRNGIKIIHSYGSSPYDTSVAIKLLRAKRVRVNKMITHRLIIQDIGLGFKIVSEAKDSMKVIIFPDKASLPRL